MKNFMDENFLLQTPTAQELYHNHAAKMPIIDYHCHLIPQMVADDHKFKSLTEIWLGGDHYKWRAMRTERCRRALLHRQGYLRLGKIREMGRDGSLYHAQPSLPLDSPRTENRFRHQ